MNSSFYLILFITTIKGNVHGDSDSLLIKLQCKVETLEKHLYSLENGQDKNNGGICGKDWISYSDTKCFKVLSTKGSEVEAKTECRQLDSSSTLITISDESEQNFVVDLLKSHNGIADNVWIGLEWTNNGFNWTDGTEVMYQNWDENAVKDGNSKCVQMPTVGSHVGKWMDDNCQKKYMIACQKKQQNNGSGLEEQIKNLTKIIENQQAKLENYEDQLEQLKNITKNSNDLAKANEKQLNQLNHATIPIGFLYTQLPNQSSPQQLWPSLQWTDVTPQYSGLFFRAEGSGSQAFGQIQSADQSMITRISTESQNTDNEHKLTKGTYYPSDEQVNLNGWTDLDPSQSNAGYPMFYSLRLWTTSAEVRPKNTAIRIWKRVK